MLVAGRSRSWYARDAKKDRTTVMSRCLQWQQKRHYFVRHSVNRNLNGVPGWLVAAIAHVVASADCCRMRLSMRRPKHREASVPDTCLAFPVVPSGASSARLNADDPRRGICDTSLPCASLRRPSSPMAVSDDYQALRLPSTARHQASQGVCQGPSYVPAPEGRCCDAKFSRD